MRVRAKQGGKSAFTWRTKADKDFSAANTVAFDWPTSAEWQEVRAEIPVRDRLLHLRITPAKDCTGLEVERIVLEGEGGNSVTFRFDAK
jgi:hypothetical protein